jgi:hypothetical protein
VPSVRELPPLPPAPEMAELAKRVLLDIAVNGGGPDAGARVGAARALVERAEESVRRETEESEERARTMSDEELREIIRRKAAALLTPTDLRMALAEAESRTAGAS